MVDQCLLNIVDAADRDDSDDVEIRGLLAAALRDSGLDLAQIMNGRIASRRASCQVGVAWRVTRVHSPSPGRRSSLVTGPGCRR